ncbi:PspC domain-containing protein [Arthrobacter sp. H41]|uniref:PspC domain-containing protein n=1 Tax=Arthrobacter sp. H41 TaxID=1312978 RepID=UPI0004B8CC68|nr:PspC domain-containing protein [Arthrobacter sp. H41]
MTSEPASEGQSRYAGAHAAGTPGGGMEQPAPAPPSNVPASNSFFSWLRSLGIVRAPDRWIGGVAGGLAARTGLDVVLVRGLLVILAVFGGIGVLLYGLAWALLPEPDGRIHTEQAGRGVWTGGMTGAALLSLMGLWRPNLPFFGDSGAGPFLWTIAWVGGVVFIIYWAVNRSRTQGSRPPAYPPNGYPAAGNQAPGGYPAAGYQARGGYPAAGYQQPGFPSPESPLGSTRTGSPSTDPLHTGPMGTGTTDTVPADTGTINTGTLPTRPIPPRPMPMGSFPADARPYQPLPPRTPRRPIPRPSGSETALHLGVALTVVGVILALSDTGVLDLGNSAVAIAVAAGAVTLGLGIIILGILGRTSGFMGLAGFLAALAAVVLPLELPQGRWIAGASGSTTTADIATAERGYTAVAAESTIDLTGLGALRDDVVIPVHSLAGDVDITVPGDVPVEVWARLFLGSVQLLDGADNFISEGVWQPGTLELDNQPTGPAIIIEVSGAVSDVTVTTQETGTAP